MSIKTQKKHSCCVHATYTYICVYTCVYTCIRGTRTRVYTHVYARALAYAKIHQWFTEISNQQRITWRAALMNPKIPHKESEVANAIEEWEAQYNQLQLLNEGFSAGEICRTNN